MNSIFEMIACGNEKLINIHSKRRAQNVDYPPHARPHS